MSSSSPQTNTDPTDFGPEFNLNWWIALNAHRELKARYVQDLGQVNDQLQEMIDNPPAEDDEDGMRRQAELTQRKARLVAKVKVFEEKTARLEQVRVRVATETDLLSGDNVNQENVNNAHEGTHGDDDEEETRGRTRTR
ncbi:hypothetical protein PG990_005951 [Apiospora arundinis]|uniref:Uncharacterized protein n=1 Tax=Apiospora arundinis TaxID=335852 RepID=A0ABR2J928_9PEZI